MSDTDTQDASTVEETTVEFTSDPFTDSTEPADAPAETPTEPAEDNAEKTEPSETTEPTEEPAAPEDGQQPDEATDAKQDVDLKGMSRAERAEYFQNLKQQQTREQSREVGEVINQHYQPQDVTELQQAYLNDYPDMDQGTALMLARQDVAEQKAQIAEATSEIAQLEANLRVDTIEAQATYDWMNPNKKDSYDKDLHDAAATIFGQGITTDERTGRVINARMTPMQAAQIVDKIRNSGTAKAQLTAQKAAEAQLAAVAPATSTAPASSANPDDKQASGLERAFGNIR